MIDDTKHKEGQDMPDRERREALLDSYWCVLSDFSDHLKSGFGGERSYPRYVMPEERPDRQGALDALARTISACTRCRLSGGRKNTVPGYGVLDPLVMCIGEAPGAEEDRTGRPFVGRAGQYLDKWLDAVGLSRETNCFIGNIIKCRPPQNRDPASDETELCLPYLREQISLIRPRSILFLGRISARILTGTDLSMAKMRGTTFQYENIPAIPTYHPSAVLRNPDLRKPVWEDLKRLKQIIGNG